MKKEEFKTINPATEEVIETYTYMTETEANTAVDSCHKAFLKWKMKSVDERGTIIKKIGKALKEHKDELAKLMTNEMGKLLKQSHQEIELCAGICEYTATEGAKQLEDEHRELPNGGRGIIQYAPIGVIYGIQPWNFPLYQVIRYSIVNLMAGNGVLLKHAKNVTGTALKIKEIFDKAGLDKDIFTVLIIDHDVSDKIIEHDKVRGVTLTGSSGAGKHVGEKAGAEY